MTRWNTYCQNLSGPSTRTNSRRKRAQCRYYLPGGHIIYVISTNFESSILWKKLNVLNIQISDSDLSDLFWIKVPKLKELDKRSICLMEDVNSSLDTVKLGSSIEPCEEAKHCWTMPNLIFWTECNAWTWWLYRGCVSSSRTGKLGETRVIRNVESNTRRS